MEADDDRDQTMGGAGWGCDNVTAKSAAGFLGAGPRSGVALITITMVSVHLCILLCAQDGVFGTTK